MVGVVEISGPVRVLVVDVTSSGCQELLEILLGDHRFSPSSAPFGSEEFAAALKCATPHVVMIAAGSSVSARKSLELVRLAHSNHPGLRTVMVLENWKDDLIVEAFRAGVTGIVCRDDSALIINKCVYSVHLGQIWANSAQLRLVLKTLGQQSVPRNSVETAATPDLTKRELEVIRAVAEGMTNRDIADHLKLSEHTVKNYLFRVFDKLGVSNRSELLMLSLSLSRSVAREETRRPEFRPGAAKSGAGQLVEH
jgi:two-component system nitrate/nitrite response regulator NarL